eukprot:jgi/Botrbrau1/10031/Bobra.0012s0118.1
MTHKGWDCSIVFSKACIRAYTQRFTLPTKA